MRRPAIVICALLASQLARAQAPARDTSQKLPSVTVTAPNESRRARLVGFYDRKQQGMGRFVDREQLARFEEQRLTNAMSATVPGVAIHYSRVGSEAWAVSTRSPVGGSCALCRLKADSVVDKYDIAKGAKPGACYMDVYVDGMLMYNSGQRPPAPLYDINSIPVGMIEAMEVYQSGAQMPARFNRTGGGCGAVVIWLR